MSVNRLCKTCEWWIVYPYGDGTLGVCYGGPPTADLEERRVRSRGTAVWPETLFGDWCRVWELREEKKDA